MDKITQKYLKAIFQYDPDTGVFTWRQRPLDHFKNSHRHNIWNTKHAGAIAGSLTPVGYWRITINNKSYKAHRLAWLYTYGKWPKGQIDHMDGNKLNNRIDNLRRASNAENNRNVGLKKSNNSGYKGVSWSKREEKWQVFIGVNGKNKNLGYYTDPQEASEAYIQAARIYHGKFARIT